MAETINGLYKTEAISRRGPWRSMGAVEFAALEWGDRFNSRRLLEPIGNIPPAEAEARCCLASGKPGAVQTRGGSASAKIVEICGAQ